MRPRRHPPAGFVCDRGADRRSLTRSRLRLGRGSRPTA